MHVECGEFNVYDLDIVMEEVKLEGDYNISFITNEHIINSYKPDDYLPEENIPVQSVYCVGNVLCRTNTENLKDLINIFMRYTYDPCDDLNLDKSIATQKVLVSGTICPTRKVLFSYKSKIFVCYGRYIFGYNQNYVVMRRNAKKKCEDIDESDEDSLCADKKKLDDKISDDEIVVNAPKYNVNALCDNYVYSFMIYDAETKVLDAFGLYR
ncbi:hypothetical protein C0J52_08167 [Blattella germanica]|nr:hypothetical protein C0J52_08167 [Blattella germanica]